MESGILGPLSSLGIGPDNRSRRADHSVPFHKEAMYSARMQLHYESKFDREKRKAVTRKV